MKLFTLVLATLTLCGMQAQKLNFVRTIEFPGYNSGLTHDHYGRSYVFHSSFYSYSVAKGSVLTGFDAHGDQVRTVMGYFSDTVCTLLGETIVNPKPGVQTYFLMSICDNNCSYIDGLSQQTKTSGIEVFPNPAETQIQLKTEVSSSDMKISIFNISGLTVHTQTLRGQNGKMSAAVDVGHLPPGIYIAEVRDGDSVRRISFIRE